MSKMSTYQQALLAVQADPRYLSNLDLGKPRRGHPEATARAHIAELESNLKALALPAQSQEHSKLLLLIHVHDSFKPESEPGVAITHPNSHASLARAFLAQHCCDPDLLEMVQYHDEPFALYRQALHKGEAHPERLQSLLGRIRDWPLFLKFLLIDGYTAGKSVEPLEWALRHLAAPLGLQEQTRWWLDLLRRREPLARAGA
jgi:hypothetical protein